jgi:fibronectin-binding autotransporter adhesin
MNKRLSAGSARRVRHTVVKNHTQFQTRPISIVAAGRLMLWLGIVGLVVLPASAQRQMEKLGRGVVAMRTGTSSAYVGWRLLATDPEGVGFNVLRSVNGGMATQINSALVTNTTDYTDATVNFANSNAWFIQPVVGTVTQWLSAPWGLNTNAVTGQYFPVPLHAVIGGVYPPYDVKFCWVGDLDGDGEYDFVVDRLSTLATGTATNNIPQHLQAYKRDGTFLWQMDMGHNSTNQYNIEPGASAISIGDKDNVTVYDLDGDGRAEVCVRTARGVILPDGSTISGPDDTTQYLSILDGLSGLERARTTITNLWPGDGPLNCRFGILYCDGVHPSLVIEGENRVGSGIFQRESMTYDYRDGQLARRWFFAYPTNLNLSWSHQFRMADVNHDGIDDLVEVGSVRNGVDGTTLFDTELIHGDRLHITDMDPDRPGLETFAIQQENPSMLGMALYESGTGRMIKKWYQTGVADVGRGIAIDIDPNYKGLEMYSTMGGIYNGKGDLITSSNLWAPEGVWWDADLLREFEDGAGSGAYNPVINKYNPVTHTNDRIYSIYSDGGSYVVRQAYGGRAAFWGDILGDWREELVLVASDYSAFRIYTTKLAATNRLVTLMQDPAYRCQATTKGYYEANYPDFYLGQDMPPPAPMPFSDAKLVWHGDGTNVWDAGITANWVTNWFWSTNTTPVAYNSGDTVLFDITGSNNTAITLAGTLTPGAVTVYAPKDFTFNGAGSLSGMMKLTKAGRGALTVNNTNDFTGATLVAEGPLIVNGALNQSLVTVRGGVWLDGRLAGSGFIGNGARIETGGGISPGNGTNSPGTLTIYNDVTFAGGAFGCFDLSDDPSGTSKTNDLLTVSGDVILTGTNIFQINPLNTNLLPGTYPLITYSGTLTGTLANQTVGGLDGFPVALTNPPGRIALLVKTVRSPATLTWTGGLNGNAWDLLSTSNWLNGATRDRFNPQDTVRFDNTGATNLTASLASMLNSGGIVVDSTSNYTFSGSGVLMGAGGLAKSNTGTLTISGKAHTYTGPTIIAGGTLSVATLGIAGAPGSIGASGASPTNLVLAGGTLQLSGDDAYTDRALTLSSGTNTFDIPSSGVQMTLVNQIIGGGKLAKTGSGLLVLTTNNTYSGGTVLKAGRILLGGALANSSGLGSGTVTLEGGTLSMSDVQASETAAWNLIVPAGATAQLDVDGRSTLSGALTGGGTLSVLTPYVRTDFSGNWSGFSNQLNVITDSDGGDFRCNHSAGYPKAKINLAALVSLQNRVSGTPTIPVGEISGAARSYISAPGGNAGIGVVWRVGGLNTSATFAGNTTNNVGFIKEGTGTWTWTGTNVHTGANTVSNGTLLVQGLAAGATGAFTVAPAGTLGGTGTLGGATTVNGKLSPGSNAIGTLTFTNNVILNAGGTTYIEVSKSPKTNDLLRVVLGRLTCGGTLRMTNLAGALTNGDSFKILDATNYTGTFATLALPALSTNLAWNTGSLYASGTLSVVVAMTPCFNSVGLAGTNLVLSGNGGVASSNYYVLASTNISRPLAQWTPIATNQFGSGGSFNFTNAIEANTPQRFYQLQIP